MRLANFRGMQFRRSVTDPVTGDESGNVSSRQVTREVVETITLQCDGV